MKNSKKLIAAILTIVTIMSWTIAPAALNEDYNYAMSDALLVLRSVVNLTKLTPEQESLYDVNEDNVVNMADALQILRMVVKLPNVIENPDLRTPVKTEPPPTTATQSPTTATAALDPCVDCGKIHPTEMPCGTVCPGCGILHEAAFPFCWDCQNAGVTTPPTAPPVSPTTGSPDNKSTPNEPTDSPTLATPDNTDTPPTNTNTPIDTNTPTEPPTDTPTSPPTSDGTARPTSPTMTQPREERPYERELADEILVLVNEARAAEGIPPIVMSADDTLLTAAANHRAKEIAQVWSHDRPDESAWHTVLVEYGVVFRRAGENLARWHSSPELAMQGWLDSPGHRANIMRPEYTEIGIGVYYENGRFYWTQLFIGQ